MVADVDSDRTGDMNGKWGRCTFATNTITHINTVNFSLTSSRYTIMLSTMLVVDICVYM